MIVIEIQKNGNQTTALTDVFSDRSVAEQKYHAVLSAAAVSSVEVHSAVMLDDDGGFVQFKSYKHGVENE